MQVISYTKARESLEAVISQVIENQEPALIRRREGGNVMLLPKQTYNSMQETLHLLSTSANTQRLLRSVDQLNAGKKKMDAPPHLRDQRANCDFCGLPVSSR